MAGLEGRPGPRHLPMGESKVHLFLHEDFDGLPVLVFRLEGDDDEMVEVSMHDWRVAIQWAVVMHYGAMQLAERSGIGIEEARTVYEYVVQQLAEQVEEDNS